MISGCTSDHNAAADTSNANTEKMQCYLLATRCLSLTSDLSNQMWGEDLTMARCTIPINPPCTWPTWGTSSTQVQHPHPLTGTRTVTNRCVLPWSSSRHWPGWWHQWELCDWRRRYRHSLVCSLWNWTHFFKAQLGENILYTHTCHYFLWNWDIYLSDIYNLFTLNCPFGARYSSSILNMPYLLW